MDKLFALRANLRIFLCALFFEVPQMLLYILLSLFAGLKVFIASEAVVRIYQL